MIGTTLSHYRVLSRIGAGGMGVIYRAHDEHLDRDVALKILPEGALATPDARERFRREALALSRLNHPHIATVHDFSRQDDTDFLVMELVEGTTLAERLAQGPIAEKEVVELGIQIAEALEAAHERGVVHRDLKPENVVVTRREQVKVLDFGIASLLRTEDGRVVSGTPGGELAPGTLLYMAPERLLGTPGDPRSDLYALGVVLYELATGQAPFQAKLATALVYEITNAAPPPPSRIRHDLSQRLEDVILKCLEKNPDYRCQTAREIAVDLRRIAATPGPAAAASRARRRPESIRSLVVLPLENLSGDPEQDFFADGMTDALIADLAQIADLRVISRTSAMRYKGARKPLPEIARELNVDAVVEGTVLRAGNRVRITAQLIEAASDHHVWGKIYQRDVADVLSMQGEVAAAIAEEIRAKLTPEQQSRWRRGRTIDPAALEAYLHGRRHWNQRTESELRRSVGYFQRAIEIEPGYAAAYSGLADSYNILGDLNALTPEVAAASARAAATRALELDDGLAEAHSSFAFLKMFYDRDWSGSEAEFQRALRLNPSYATGHQWYSELLSCQGHHARALDEARKAVDLDPLATILRSSLADAFYFARRYDEAIDELRRAIAMEPGFMAAHTDLGRAYAQAGRYDESIASFEEALRLSGSDTKASPGIAYSLALAGRTDEARSILARFTALRAERYVSSHAIAVVHLGLGEKDEAFDWLNQAIAERDRALVWAKVHPRLDPLREDPRFREVLLKAGFVG